MNYKQLLKFYFYADGLNGALDKLAVHYAVSSADCAKGWDYYADKICALTEAKAELAELWAFLDGALSSVTEEDRRALKAYSVSAGRAGRAFARIAAGGGNGGKQREVTAESADLAETAGKTGGKELHRSLMKFSRRVSGKIGRFSEPVKVLKEYYCFLNTR